MVDSTKEEFAESENIVSTEECEETGDIRKNLEDMFDDMLGQVKYFKRDSYQSVFEDSYEKYRLLIQSLTLYYEKAEEGEAREALIEELAEVIPSYAQAQILSASKRQKSSMTINYNLTMAVYVIPMLIYQKFPVNEKIADRMVQFWNEKNVTGNPIQKATFEDIDGGFKRKLCYITTAVCRKQNKPDDCRELTTLRTYRDQYLMQTEDGRRLVNEYYNIAPGIVFSIEMQRDSDQIYDRIYEDYLIPCIRYAENGQNGECKELYTDMVRQLQSYYLGV